MLVYCGVLECLCLNASYASGRPVRLEVDGGIKVENIASVANAGADTFVAGSAIFNEPDYAQVISAMRSNLGSS